MIRELGREVIFLLSVSSHTVFPNFCTQKLSKKLRKVTRLLARGRARTRTQAPGRWKERSKLCPICSPSPAHLCSPWAHLQPLQRFPMEAPLSCLEIIYVIQLYLVVTL